MALRYDIRFNNVYINANNDIEVFKSDMAHVKCIINSGPNEFKESPFLGVNINKYLNSAGMEDDIKRNVMLSLQSDGYNADNPIVEYNNNQLLINPNLNL